MKKIVGVLSLWDEKKDSMWMLPGYLNGLQEFDLLPIMLPFTNASSDLKQILDMCDGFLFTGGHDVDPSCYLEEILYKNVVSCSYRDEMEYTLMKMVIEADKPMLGICRGHQLLNVVNGGTLYQDLLSQHEGINHNQPKPYDEPYHSVTIKEETPLFTLLKKKEKKVNSCHHQAIKDLGKDLQVMAVSEDGLIESVCMKDKKFIWSVQWHPEFNYQKDEDSKKIFEIFSDAIKNDSFFI